MATIKRFEDLEIWQLARELLYLIYEDFEIVRTSILKIKLSLLDYQLKTTSLKDSHEIVTRSLSSSSIFQEDQMEKSKVCIILLKIKDMSLQQLQKSGGTEPMFYMKR